MYNIKKNRPLALITGASKRIGCSIAKELHHRGVDVAIHCNRSKVEADELSVELNHIRRNSAIVIQECLTTYDASKSILKKSLAHSGRIDYLVNNASIFSPLSITNADDREANKVFNINSKQPRMLIERVSQELIKRSGSIVNLIDIYALRGLQNHALYTASKAILLEMTKQFAVELSPNVRVNSVSPGAILWPENETQEQKRQRAEILEKTAIKRIGKASDISRAVSFLLLDANYMTGANINVDGGRNLFI